MNGRHRYEKGHTKSLGVLSAQEEEEKLQSLSSFPTLFWITIYPKTLKTSMNTRKELTPKFIGNVMIVAMSGLRHLIKGHPKGMGVKFAPLTKKWNEEIELEGEDHVWEERFLALSRDRSRVDYYVQL